MPVFMFISGYFSFLSLSKNDKLSIIRSRFFQLVVPYVFWILYGYLIYKFTGFKSTENPWFLIELFYFYLFIVCFHYFLAKAKPQGIIDEVVKSIFMSCILIASLWFLSRPLMFGVDVKNMFFFLIPFFISGYFCHRWKSKLTQFKDIYQIGSSVLFIILFCTYSWKYKFSGLNIIATYPWMNSLLVMTLAFLGCAVFFRFIKIANKNDYFSSVMSYLGGRTLEIYILHFVVLDFIPNVPTYNSYWLALLVGCVVVFLIVTSLLLSAFLFPTGYALTSCIIGKYSKFR